MIKKIGNYPKQKNYVMKKIIQLAIMCLLFMSNLIYANNQELICNLTTNTFNESIVITGLTGDANVKLFDQNYTTVWECNPWYGSPCSSNESISGLTAGDIYYLSVQSDDCNEWRPITVAGFENCGIAGTISNCTYTENGVYTYDIYATSNNSSSNTFTITLNIPEGLITQDFAYNQTHTITEWSITNQEASKVIWETENPNCAITVTAPCQPISGCEISGSISNCIQNNAGVFSYELLINGPQEGNYLAYLYNVATGPYTQEFTYNETHFITESGFAGSFKYVEDISNTDCNIQIPLSCNSTASEVTIENCPQDMIVELPLNQGETIVSWVEPFCNSTCAGDASICLTNQTSGPTNGDYLTEGSYNVTYEANDGCNNTATCSFSITVEAIASGCNIEYTTNPSAGEITVTGLSGNANAKLFTSSFTSLWGCDPWNGSPCSNLEVISGLFAGETYYLSIQSDVCDEWIPITLTGGGECSLQGTISNCTYNNISVATYDIFVTGMNTSGNTFSIQVYQPVVGLQTLELEYNTTHTIFQSQSPINLSKTIWDTNNPDCSTIITATCQPFESEVTLTNCPQDFTVFLFDDTIDEYVSWTEPNCNSTCAGDAQICFVNQIAGPTNGSYLSEGTYTITYEAQDGCGNTATCSFDITVTPSITECNLQGSIYNCEYNNAGLFTYNIFISSPNIFSTTFLMAINTGQGVIFQEYNYGEEHSISEAFLTAPQFTKTITDGLDFNCTTTITAECQPVSSGLTIENCPLDLSFTTLTPASWSEPFCNSTCAGNAQVCVTNQVAGPTNGSFLAPGIYTVTYEAQDGCNNTATCSFDVTVVGDPIGCAVNAISENGSIIITGLTASENTKLFDENFNVAFECNPWNGNPCSGYEEVTGLNIGDTYFLSVQSNECNEWIPIEVDGNVGDCYLIATVSNTSCTPSSVTYDLLVTGDDTSTDKFGINLTIGFGTTYVEYELNQTHTITEYIPGGNPTLETWFVNIFDPNINDCSFSTSFSCQSDCIIDTDGDGTCNDEDCQPTNPFLPTIPGSACSDNDVTTFNDMIQADGCTCIGTPSNGCTNTTNIALGKPTSQSSTISFSGITAFSDLAVDGNTDGEFFNGSVAATQEEYQAWWEVDLGAVYDIELIEIYNKTNGNDKLTDYYYMFSDTPFNQNGSTEDNLAIADFSKGKFGVPSSYSFTQFSPATSARYVRIQLEGTGYCTIAEVVVTGCTATPPSPNESEVLNLATDPRITNSFSIQSVFPNPANQFAFVKIDSKIEEELTLEFYDLVGQLQQQTIVSIEEGNNTLELDVHHLNAGIYNLFLRNNKGLTKSVRFVKIND